jgi:hypothetical protein
LVRELVSVSFGIRVSFFYVLEILPCFISYVFFIFLQKRKNEEEKENMVDGVYLKIKPKKTYTESDSIFTFDE